MENIEFKYEALMNAPVSKWLEEQDLKVRSEFSTSVGTCDLVGCAFDRQRLEIREGKFGKKKLGPPLRISLWFSAPQCSPKRGKKIAEFEREYRGIISKKEITTSLDRLCRDGFLVRSECGKYSKFVDWYPLHERLVAVELKLSRVRKALRQASSYQAFATDSYVALPIELAKRVAGRYENDFSALGIGLLGVSTSTVKVIRESQTRAPGGSSMPVVEAHSAERFWAYRQ